MKSRISKKPALSDGVYRSLFENMMHGFTYCKVIFEKGKAVDYVYLAVNGAYESFTGLSDLVGRKLTEAIPGLRESDPGLFETFGRVAATGIPEKFEQYVSQLDKWFLVSMFSHEKGYFVGLIDDISESKRGEEHLKKTLKELSTYKYALDESAIVAITDQKGIIRHANNNFCKISKYSAGELLGKDHRIINSGYHSKEFIRNLWVTIGHGKIWRGELKNRAKDGTFYWVDTTIVPFLDENDKPYQYVAIRSDITERKKAEEQRALYASIVNSSDDAILSKTLDGNVTSWNHGAEKVFGYTAQEMLGKNVSVLIPADRLNEEPEIIQKIKRGEFVDHYETQRIRKDNTLIHISLTISPIKDSQGKIIGASKIARDISEQKAAGEKLAASERRFKALTENSTDGIALISADAKLSYQSPSVERILGYTFEERTAQHTESSIHPDSLADFLKLGDELKNNPGKPIPYQYRFRHKKGHYIWLDGVLTNFLHNPTVNAVVTNFRDITEQKEAEAEILKLNADLEKKVLQRTAQLEAVNKELEAFSYSVSHDLRAPLRIIDGFGQILMDDYLGKLDEKGQRTLNVIMSNARKMGQLIDDLLNFSKLGRSEIRMSDVNMNELADEVLQELGASGTVIPTHLTVNRLRTAVGDRNLLKQVWMNLFSNAIKYSSGKTDPVIEVGMLEEKSKHVYYVKDNGAGFNMQYAENLFGVFQRLHKEADFPGTGVGLALVQRIILRHGGTIWAEAKENEGATFYFSLPEKEEQSH